MKTVIITSPKKTLLEDVPVGTPFRFTGDYGRISPTTVCFRIEKPLCDPYPYCFVELNTGIYWHSDKGYKEVEILEYDSPITFRSAN